MTREDAIRRRTVLKVTGVAGASALLAGCGGPETDNETENGGGGGVGNETTDGGVGNETTGEGDGNETTGGNETGGNQSAAADWEDVDTIALDGYTQAWEGVEPAAIEGEENPTLQLQAGETYTVEWTNADGQPHDFVIQDADGGELEGTGEQLQEEGASETLEFEATEEMVQYICTIHPTTMVADVEVS